MSIFSHISARRPRRNKFDLSHERKFSFRMGELVPILLQDVVPGDKFRVKSEVFLRMAPMLAPIMHRVNVFTHYFWVPNRLVWSEWEDFITGGREGDANPIAPYFETHNDIRHLMDKGMLTDYFGLPLLDQNEDVTNPVRFSALPFRAYQLIYNEYYRDQNLTEPIDIDDGSGAQGFGQHSMLEMRKRAWEKDYFTSALPWAQRGGAVEMPFDVNIDAGDINYRAGAIVRDGSSVVPNEDLGTNDFGQLSPTGSSSSSRSIDNIESIEAEGGSVSINELRRSIKLQEWLEKNARGGARYVEQILSHFGVRSSDARLQRPEYLGGGRQPVQISEVLSTFQESGGEGNPLATMAGHGVAVGNSNQFTRFFEEHGYVVGLMSVLPKTAYQQGLPRHFTRFDKFDYYWPEFAQIGEQEIKNKELYYSSYDGSVDPEGTFGYTPRYAEYKYAPSTVHGEFRDTLSFWHMGRIFSSAPALNESFVTSDPTDRIFAVAEEEHMYCQLYNRVDAIRPMPYFGTPTI